MSDQTITPDVDVEHALEKRATELNLRHELEGGALVIYDISGQRGIVRHEQTGIIRVRDESAWRKASLSAATDLLDRQVKQGEDA